MSKKIKVGILGLRRGRIFLAAEQILHDEMEVIAVCESEEEVIKSAQNFRLNDDMPPLLKEGVRICKDYDELLDSGIEAVILCNYFPDHAKFAIKAMEKGVAVFSETTAAPSLGECVELVETYERTGTKYMLAANCVFFKAVQDMQRTISQEKYGKVIYADAEYIHPPEDPNYDYNADLNNLHWRDTTPPCYYNMHDLGPLMYITGSMPKKVVARAVVTPGVYNGRPRDSAKNYVLVDMDNGSICNYSGGTGVGTLSKWYRIACKGGTVESVRYDEPEEMVIECGTRAKRGEDSFVEKTLTWAQSGALTEEEEAKYMGDGFDEEFHGGVDVVLTLNFLKYLRGEKEPFFNVYRAAALSATGILAWYSILSDSKPFEIPDFTKKEDRDRVRNDYRNLFAKKYNELELPCNAGNKFNIEL